MSDILCIYYSRTGNTKKAVEKIARELDAESAGTARRGGPFRLAGLFSAAGWRPCAVPPIL